MSTRRIYITCNLTQGSFSGEIIFEVKTAEGATYVGVAPRRDCRSMNGEALTEKDLSREKPTEGKLVARLIGNGGDLARVALPDGEAITLSVKLVSERESEVPCISETGL